MTETNAPRNPATYTPRSVEEARATLTTWFGTIRGQLENTDTAELLTIWNAAACMFPGIHPDNVNPTPETVAHNDNLPEGFPQCLRDYDDESGWPLALIPVAMEMWRRYEEGIVSDHEFYCVESALARLTTIEF